MTAQPLIERTYPDLPGFDKENRSLIFAMVEAGWRGRITSKGHWMGRAPDGKQQITVPSKQGNNRGLKNASAQFAKWLRAQMPPEEQALYDTALTEQDPMIKDVIAEGLVRKQTTRLIQEGAQREVEEAYDRMRELLGMREEPITRPWLARKQPGPNGGQRYESQAVLERVWPDGRIDYGCALDGCPYSSENPVSVARHYGAAHTRKGTQPAETGPVHPDPAYTEPQSTRDYRPTQRLVDALADWIDTTDLSSISPQELAVLFLTWAHERPDIEHETRPLVPLSDRQTLDRIRMLVGVPDPDQTEQIESLTGELIEARRQRDEANAHLVRVQRDLDALSDMVKGIGR